ncbi:thiolase family protein [Candidatus Aerophobetes bacterium]|uniref:Thiolase family protein n=1 Tax=Aerophobetes bacterium TaxID=2030807 RepID=A0A523YS47_UNCAE|nr:MAG: thiolase family protein [Candidatus Aerophobetes bacterium]
MLNKDIAIVSYSRTPVGKFGMSLKDISSLDLGALVIRAAVKRAGLKPEQIDRVVMGENIQTTPRGDPARHVLLRAGLSFQTDDYSINMNCSSGMRAVVCAAQDIILGEREIIVAGGMENMSLSPHFVEGVRWGLKLGGARLVDFLSDYLLPDAGPMAENVAERYGISRSEQDEFAYESHMRAIKAIDEKKFVEEIVPVPVKAIKEKAAIETVLEDKLVPLPEETTGNDLFKVDEHPRRDTSLEKLSSLRPIFKRGGTVTAGNASGINDGAAALVLMKEEKAKEFGLSPLAHLRAWESAGIEPELFGMGPVPAVKKLLNKENVNIEHIDLFEINEAFASSTIAVMRELKIDPQKVNPNGGAIALGHPVGATGVIIMIKLINEMRRRKSKYGIAAMCVGSGQGMAVMIEV